MFSIEKFRQKRYFKLFLFTLSFLIIKLKNQNIKF